MKTKDLLTICLQNLTRHKSRTFLTVLGVIIGCCSVVIMISIGIGMKEAQKNMLAQMGDLTIINVYSAGKGSRSAKLNNQVIRRLKEMKSVEAVTPKLTAENIPITLYAGRNRRYKSAYTTIVGIDVKAAEAMGYKLTDGTWDKGGRDGVFVGENFAYMFEDTKRPSGRNTVDMYSGYDNLDESGMPVKPQPYFDSMKTAYTLDISSDKEDDKKITRQLEAAGRMKEDYGKGEETSMGLVMDLEMLKTLLDQQAKLSGRKPEWKKGYSGALVKVKDMNQVAEVETEIKRMGFRTSSMETIRKPMEREARQKQMMLGGLGAISLFVAALGITNTMIMSISERTREIGVMKSLGCFVRDIRRIFLLEAGCIGLLGGVTGTVFSYAISFVMNMTSEGMSSSSMAGAMEADMAGLPSRLSVIPWWLSLFAVLFSIAVGVGAGYYPAGKAVKISALEAIKHD